MVRFSLCFLFLSLFVVSVTGQTMDCKNDWPNLARYRDDNAKISAPAKAERRVVFMGDSITDSWDDPSTAVSFPASPTSIAASAAKPRRKCSFAFAPT